MSLFCFLFFWMETWSNCAYDGTLSFCYIKLQTPAVDLDYLYRWVLADSCYSIIPQFHRWRSVWIICLFFFYGCHEKPFIPAVFSSLPSQEVCMIRINNQTQERVCFLVFDFSVLIWQIKHTYFTMAVILLRHFKYVSSVCLASTRFRSSGEELENNLLNERVFLR